MAERAARRYGAAVLSGLVPTRADGHIAAQVAGFSSAVERTAIIRQRVRDVLDRRRIPLTRLVLYANFALRVDRINRTRTGRTRDQLIALALARWTALGCDPDVLSAIAGSNTPSG